MIIETRGLACDELCMGELVWAMVEVIGKKKYIRYANDYGTLLAAGLDSR